MAFDYPKYLTRQRYQSTPVPSLPVVIHRPIKYKILDGQWPRGGWPKTGWLDNFSHRAAQRRRDAGIDIDPSAPPTTRNPAVVEYMRAGVEIFNDSIATAHKRRNRFEDEDGNEDENEDEGDDEDEDGQDNLKYEWESDGSYHGIDQEVFDSDGASRTYATPRARRGKDKNSEPLKFERKLPHYKIPEAPMDWAEAFSLFRRGLDHAAIDKSNFSEYAFLDPIPELEDENPTGREPFKLLDHQREALGWWLTLTKRHGHFLLADDMGLGKTAVAVARIKLALVSAQEAGEKAIFLVIVPASLMNNWRAEFSRVPSINVLQFHSGPERGFGEARIVQYDVVLTSYDVVGSEYSQLQRAHCDFQDTRAGRKYVIQRKLEQAAIAKAKKNNKKRKINPEVWQLVEERPEVPLLSIAWTEIITDESHTLRNKTSRRSNAVLSLVAQSRVCMTGIPIQNGYKDLFALLRFMRIAPWSTERNFNGAFIKKAHCKKGGRLAKDLERVLGSVINAISLRRTINHSFFNGHPITGVKNVRGHAIFLELGPAAQKLQEPTMNVWSEQHRQEQAERDNVAKKLLKGRELTVKEKAIMQKEAKEAQKAMLKKIFEARCNAFHLELLQAKYNDTGGLELEGFNDIEQNASMLLNPGDLPSRAELNASAQDEVQLGDRYRLGDKYAQDQWESNQREQWEQNRRAFKDRITATPEGWESDETIPIVAEVIDILDKVDEECSRMVSETQRKEHRARNKIIIFGDMLAALDILDYAIRLRIGPGITVHFNGTQSKAKRQEIEDRFEEKDKSFAEPNVYPDPAVIMLANIKAAAEGLNFVHARHVLFSVPNWNPYVEDQAIARANRIGQQDRVCVYRFHVVASIEKRILEVASFKRSQVAGLQDRALLLETLPKLREWTAEKVRDTVSPNSEIEDSLKEIFSRAMDCE